MKRLCKSFYSLEDDYKNECSIRQLTEAKTNNYKNMKKINEIYNFLKIDDLLYTSGQPEIEELKKLKEAGVEIVVNLREDHEMEEVFDEEKLLRELGLRYISIPLILDIVDNDLLKIFFKTLNEIEGKKTLIHCHRNIRVSALMGFHKVLNENVGREEAFTNLRKFRYVTPELDELLDEIIEDWRKAH